MLLQLIRARRRQVLVDINTQRDVLLAAGSDCVRNHRRVLAHIRRMMAWARSNDIPVISTCELPAAKEGSALTNGKNGLAHSKIGYTLLDNHISFSPDNNTDLPRDLLRRYRQVILPKRCPDPFDEPRIDRLLSEVRAGEFILMGTMTEEAVSAMALGLLQRHKNVKIIVDAVGARDHNDAKMALRKMEAKGAKLLESKKIAGTSHLRIVGACECDSCRRVMAKQN
ncbi:MAG: cysteine hydrolase [Planctomycetes bacterium]|nr:cysteine hydrolase [Planctomycetota bacterium]